MPLVATRATPLSEADLATGVFYAYPAVFGGPPSHVCWCTGLAQVALETGRGKHVLNYNFGNITVPPDSSSDYYQVTTTEFDHETSSVGTVKRLCYKSYDSAQAGAVDYWIKLRDHYASALALFDTDPHAAGLELHRLYYYTANPQQYSASLASLSYEYQRRFNHGPS